MVVTEPAVVGVAILYDMSQGRVHQITVSACVTVLFITQPKYFVEIYIKAKVSVYVEERVPP